MAKPRSNSDAVGPSGQSSLPPCAKHGSSFVVEIQFHADRLGPGIRNLNGQPTLLLPDYNKNPRVLGFKSSISCWISVEIRPFT